MSGGQGWGVGIGCGVRDHGMEHGGGGVWGCGASMGGAEGVLVVCVLVQSSRGLGLNANRQASRINQIRSGQIRWITLDPQSRSPQMPTSPPPKVQSVFGG